MVADNFRLLETPRRRIRLKSGCSRWSRHIRRKPSSLLLRSGLRLCTRIGLAIIVKRDGNDALRPDTAGLNLPSEIRSCWAADGDSILAFSGIGIYRQHCTVIL